MYGYVLAPAVSPMSIESHCEWLRAFFAVGWICMPAAHQVRHAAACKLACKLGQSRDNTPRHYENRYATSFTKLERHCISKRIAALDLPTSLLPQ